MQNNVDASRRKHNNHLVSPDSLLLQNFCEEYRCVLQFFINLLVFTLCRENRKVAIPIMILQIFLTLLPLVLTGATVEITY